MKSFTFTIHGRVISKKNSRQWIVRGGKRFLTPSDAFQAFKNNAVAQIIQEFKGKCPRFSKRLDVRVTFHIKGAIRIDLDNALTSIFDILQDKQFPVILDDELVDHMDVTKVYHASDWITHIQIIEKEGGE